MLLGKWKRTSRPDVARPLAAAGGRGPSVAGDVDLVGEIRIALGLRRQERRQVEHRRRGVLAEEIGHQRRVDDASDHLARQHAAIVGRAA